MIVFTIQHISIHIERGLIRSIYVFAFGVYNFKQVDVAGIQIFLAQLLVPIFALGNVECRQHLPVWIYTHQMQIYRQVFSHLTICVFSKLIKTRKACYNHLDMSDKDLKL